MTCRSCGGKGYRGVRIAHSALVELKACRSCFGSCFDQRHVEDTPPVEGSGLGTDMTVWKFPLVCTDEQELQIPAPARILSVGKHLGTPCAWALVRPEQELKRKVKIVMLNTGQSLPGGVFNFLGTILDRGGFARHFFEVDY